MKKIRFYFVAFSIISILSFQSCTNNENGSDTVRVQLILVDAPGDYEEVNIDLVDILVNSQEDEGGWTSLDNVNPGIYNLIELTGGAEALLADVELPSGYLNQIRLILGENNTLKIEGEDELIPLKTPSAQQSGLKLNLHTELTEGITYTFILDWDAEKSVVKAGNSGNYNLKPTIRVTTEAASGAIKGMIVPDSVQTVVKAFIPLQMDTLTTLTNEGVYFIHGVPPGVYKLLLEPHDLSVYKDSVIESVVVTLGVVADAGITELEEK